MNRTKQESPPSQTRQDEMDGFSFHQPSNATDIFLLEAIAKQVANSETEAAKAIANIQGQIEELVMMFSTEAQKKTRAYIDKVNKIKAEQEAKAELEEKARAYEEILEKNDAEATARAEFEARVEPERQARTEAEAKAESYAKASAEIEKKLQAQALAKVEAEEQLEAEIQARHRAERQAKAEAQERAKAETRVQVQSKVIGNVQAQMEELAMMFRTEAQKKTRAYEKLPAKNDAAVKTRAETESQAGTEAEANELKDKVIAGPRVKEMVHPQRLPWSQWLLRGIREDNITAVIVFCLLLYIVPSALVISGYFVYTLLSTFL
jgi:hypothetical protein